MKFTERALRIFKNAELEAEKTTDIVYPVHLILGMLLERTGVCAELYINYPKLWDILNERIKEIDFNKCEQGIAYQPFTINISLSTVQILENAGKRMKHFRQVYLNEGHLADAIFKSDDHSTNVLLDGLDVSRILEILSYPRDMIVPLKDYIYPNIPLSNIYYRKANKNDIISLKNYVENEFGNRWLDSIENGFLQDDIPIFVALDNEQVVGFACFDVVRKKRGLFGPMGTSYSNRSQGVGYTLLHHCLKEMKMKGYEYAVIGQAGPLEFYEKACNAVVIPKTNGLIERN